MSSLSTDENQGEVPNVLDLVDIATLINYERTSREPRFRHMKLRDVAFPGDPDLPPSLNATMMVFDDAAHKVEENEADLPSNMLSTNTLPKVYSLPTKQLKTIFYQARAHDGCFACIAILQHFFRLLPSSAQLRIRHGEPTRDYTTSIDMFRIVEQTFIKPRHATVSSIMPRGDVLTSGTDNTLVHAVAGFGPNEDSNRYTELKDTDEIVSFLDLSSLQFGDVGRGPGAKGQGLFALDTDGEFRERMAKIAEGTIESEMMISHACRPSPQL